ncbi:MAG: serine/threonine-protein kinase [Vicinamibacterales bacterium]
MTPPADPLTTLAESVADGEPIDWDALDALAEDPELRGLVEHLRVVAGIAEVHRTQTDEIDASPLEVAAHTADPADDRERWGHLALVRKLGQGAFGEVYLAHDTWLDHPRALKLLKPEVANRLSPEQLLHEARKLVRVRHPNVVAVHGADRHEGRVGFWMDYVDGQTLGDRVDEACLEADEASAIGRELCDALSAVHRAGLIHRDIKAQNVMRGADGRIFLMDFGAGEFMGASPGGRPQGTPLYLAPELFSGGAASVQSDIYAVGVLLYHLVTGEFPVQAGSVTELTSSISAQREATDRTQDGSSSGTARSIRDGG